MHLENNNEFDDVLHFINENLNKQISLKDLSDHSPFSKYHFHRMFSSYLGVSVSKYMQLQRLKKSAYQLSFRKHLSITDIAFDAGFENCESFSRAFKKILNQSPSKFRANSDWQPWLKVEQQLIKQQNKRVANKMTVQDKPTVNIVIFPETKIAVLEHRGSPTTLMLSVSKFITWRKSNQLSRKVSKTFNLLYDDPNHTNEEDFRFDICAQTQVDIKKNPLGIVNKTIPQSRCAVLRNIGSDNQLELKINYLYNTWLVENNEELLDFPCFLERVSFFPDVKEHEMITDIYLPLK